jgi:hypothetical protein
MPGRGRLFSFLLSAAALTPPAASAGAQQASGYHRRELTIPMRDGTTLFAVALVPDDTSRPFPIVLVRAELPAAYRELAEDGYIFVAEDIRGRFGSGGVFVTNRGCSTLDSPARATGVDSTPSWLGFRTHPSYDSYWQARAALCPRRLGRAGRRFARADQAGEQYRGLVSRTHSATVVRLLPARHGRRALPGGLRPDHPSEDRLSRARALTRQAPPAAGYGCL